MAFRKEVADMVLIHALDLEHLQGNNGFTPFGFVDDPVTTFADLLLKRDLTEIDIQRRVEDAVLDRSFRRYFQCSDIELRCLFPDIR